MPTVRRTHPRTRLNVVELERRDTPAWWSVTAPTPATGTLGDTAATHTGQLAFSPDYPPSNGTVTVFAASAAEAAAKALAGTITVSVGGQATGYPFGPATVGAAAADHRPFLAVVSGSAVTILFEDMAGQSGCDWDYNDRSWDGVTVAGSTSPVVATDSRTFTAAPGAVKVDVSVTDRGGGTLHWAYTVTGKSFTAVGGYGDGVSAFLLNVPAAARPLVVAGSPSSTQGWGWYGHPNSVLNQIGWDGSSDSQLGSWIPDLGSGTFEFDTAGAPVGTIAVSCWNGGLGAAAGGAILGPVEPPPVSIAVDKLIPVNANNDNFKPVYDATGKTVTNEADRWVAGHPFIPRKRDFNVEKLWQDDPQLSAATITITGTGPGGKVKLRIDDGNTPGKIQAWKDRRKNERFVEVDVPANQATWSTGLWLEGKHESVKTDEIGIQAVYTLAGAVSESDTKKTGVTPIAVDKPGTLISNPPVTINEADGLTTGAEGVGGARDQQGIAFLSEVVVTDEKIRYSQYLVSIDGLMKYSAASGVPQYICLDPATLAPLRNRLDSEKDDQDNPIYKLYISDAVPNVPSTVSAFMIDTPSAGKGVVIRGNKPIELHLTDLFKTYLLVQYIDGSLYAFFNTNWKVELHGTASNQAAGGIDTVVAPSGTALVGAGWVRNNEDPAVTKGPNAKTVWRLRK